jgi:hypothetical protein
MGTTIPSRTGPTRLPRRRILKVPPPLRSGILGTYTSNLLKSVPISGTGYTGGRDPRVIDTHMPCLVISQSTIGAFYGRPRFREVAVTRGRQQ